MSQFDEHSGCTPAQSHTMSAESFVAALAANVSHMSAEALRAYVVSTLPMVRYAGASRTAGNQGGNGQFGDH